MRTSGAMTTGGDVNRPDHLGAAASLYGVKAEELKAVGAFESDVYEFSGADGLSILKVMPPGHRTTELVQAEVHWLLALLDSGVPVSRPLTSKAGTWVEELSDTGHVVVAYARADGEVPKKADWTVGVLERWGELLGQLQTHSRGWTEPGPRRRKLIEQTYIRRLDEMAEEFPEFHGAATRLLEVASPLLGGAPADQSSDDAVAVAGRDAGLLHADLHHGNLLLHEGALTAIDFDDCAYGSYAFDMAMPIYYAVRAQRETPAAVSLEGFLPHFICGFRRKAEMPAGGAEAIDVALRFRQAELVLALRAKLPPNAWTPGFVAVEEDLRQRVVNETEFVPLEVLERCLGG